MRVLVVGQGLAGTLASHFALKRGWDVQVIDAGFPSASQVAAGMFNPMSFRRIVEVWDARIHLDHMLKTYGEMQSILGIQVLHTMPILKCLPNDQYAEDWKRKAQTLPWLDGDIAPESPQQGKVTGGGWVNLPHLISKWRQWLETNGRFGHRPLTQEDRNHLKNGVWDAIIDCRGVHVQQDPATAPLDIRGNRGELLTISIPEGSKRPPSRHILNFGKWTIPVANQQWRLGASYEWHQDHLNPTEQTAQVLIDKLKQTLPGLNTVAIVDHQVGIRPVSRDRRPAVGPLPGMKGWFVLNGLGTRGVLIGPRWADYLCNVIDNKESHHTAVETIRLWQKA